MQTNKSNNNRIDYVEFHVSDIAKSKAFYGKAFDWTFTDFGPAYCEFQDGRLTGGFTTEGEHGIGNQGGGNPHTGGALIILYATDLEATQTKLEKQGAKIVKPIFSFPGGRRFHFKDLDGYVLGVWSDN